ncbi:hypothetical protein RJ640_027118 [Escallonia rubra]|uniref:Uncharacterized protein n=1 Tax=Escallonia rubra TaxID=112253 RepID=A0AA88QTT3_9ASTE|nr:hypothetical protein RJ640_027118 [Escallonia rubra]
MEMVAEEPAIASLAAALEQATQSAKQLPNATHPSQIHQIYSTLHSAHHHLSSFLSQSARLPPPTFLPHHHHPPPLNSVSSPVCSDDDDHEIEPMQVGDGDEEVEAGQSWKPTTTVEVVEERMRDCFIQNKRPKRPLSPSSAPRWRVSSRRL